MRALKIAGGAAAVVIVVLAVLLVIGIPSGFLTSAIAERVERETGYRLTIAGSTKVGLWPSLNVTLTDVTLDKPGNRETSGLNRLPFRARSLARPRHNLCSLPNAILI